MPADLIASYIHKNVRRQRRNSDLVFATSQSLFSSNAIDPGTNLLLRTISANASGKYDRCLDMGCGYGPLGLSLKREDIVGSVDLVDRDALAVDFTRMNCAKNEVNGASIYGSLGFDDVPNSNYDLIVSNLPGKAGKQVLEYLLKSATERLDVSGEFWGVIVSPLWPYVEEALAGLNTEFPHVESGPRHLAFGFRKPVSLDDYLSSEQANVYGRDEVKFEVGAKGYQITTSHGLPEFDSLSYPTQLLLEQLYTLRKKKLASAAVFNVTQGYVPIALLAAEITEDIYVTDRDLLALRTTEQNAADNRLNNSAIYSHHAISWLPSDSSQFELVAGTLRGDEPRKALEMLLEETVVRLGPDGIAMIAGASTPITRMQSQLSRIDDVQIVAREKYRGSSVISFQKTT